MWNDEDNNPYSSFDGRSSGLLGANASSDDGGGFEDSHLASIGTGSKTVQEQDNHPHAQQQTDESPPEAVAKTKKGGYDSRIERMLYEDPDLQILITDGSKSHEGGGNFIAYTIRTGDLEVRRRYSEFASLRAALVSLHPTLIIPPIPEKHSMADYAAKPTKAKEDTGIIDQRKRMLAVFLNRCRKMPEVREDGFWWRFLDPNVSWSEILHSNLISGIPKSSMRAPPLDPGNPTPAHAWLPIPSSSAKLKSASKTSASGTPASPIVDSKSTRHHERFPPTAQKLSETELDPYFSNFESSTRELEHLLQGNIEKVNRRTISHIQTLAADMAELGARLNAFSLSEQSPTVAAAIERVGQAVDSTYIATEELSAMLGATFAEPMRESAQFASVVRSVLRYRIMKRIQEEMTRDELASKNHLLENLESSEQEAQRIDQYLNTAGQHSSGQASIPEPATSVSTRTSEDGSETDANYSATSNNSTNNSTPAGSPARTRSRSGGIANSSGSITNKILGRISHTLHGIVDVDPERTRRDQISKTKESILQLEQALKVAENDVGDASTGVLKDLKRFQADKEEDLRRYMIAYAKCHVDWAQKNVETWREAKEEVERIEVD